MTNEVKWLLEELVKYGMGFTALGVVAYFVLTRWLANYLSEKGKNLATKEDIGELTKLVKDVEHGYNVLLEERKSTQQLRMVALEKRLEVHQEAFVRWHKMLASTDQETVIQARQWWNENCLFLEPTVRQAFTYSCTNFQMFLKLLEMKGPEDKIMDAWNNFLKFPPLLFTAIQLPALTPLEN